MICKPPYFIKLKQNICNNYQNVSKHFQRQWLNWLNSRERERWRETLAWQRKRERESPSAVQETHCYDYYPCPQTENKSHSQKCFLNDTQWKNKNH